MKSNVSRNSSSIDFSCTMNVVSIVMYLIFFTIDENTLKGRVRIRTYFGPFSLFRINLTE